MVNEKMTVHEALSEMKRMDSRIQSAINDAMFVATKTHSSKQVIGMDVEKFKDDAKAAYDKVTSLIDRRNAIKRAITLSNAKTMVEINGKQYTVAEAIDMKDHGCELVEWLVDRMSIQLNAAKKKVDYNESKEFQTSIENYLISMFGAKEAKTASAEIQKAREDFIAMKSVELIDPLNISEKIQRLTDDISAFTSKCDSALSVSNALTTIEIEY